MSERYIIRKDWKNFDNFNTEICNCDTEFLINNSNSNIDEVDNFRDIEIILTQVECPDCHKKFHLKRQINR